MATANAGPGCILALLEAKALLAGQDGPEEDAVNVHRQMLLGMRVRAVDVCQMLQIITHAEGDAGANKFWLRFARDCFADQQSREAIILSQLLLGRGCGVWSTTGLSVPGQLQVRQENC